MEWRRRKILKRSPLVTHLSAILLRNVSLHDSSILSMVNQSSELETKSPTIDGLEDLNENEGVRDQSSTKRKKRKRVPFGIIKAVIVLFGGKGGNTRAVSMI
jgi:hypothetical protein